MDGTGLTQRVDADGVLRIVFDDPGARVNLLSAGLLQDLDRILDEARRLDEIRAILFASGKPRTFVAGLDVDQISRIEDAFQGAEGARFGQGVLGKIEGSGKPSACAINGICISGGAELALACAFRVAADDPAVRIGLPETQVGIIPGFGGTQRLPRLLGLRRAMDLILSGRKLGARAAFRVGLVDRVVPREYVERESLELLRQAIDRGEAAVRNSLRRRRSPVRLAIDRVGPLRRLALDQERKRVEKKATRASYPAPFRALEAIEASLAQPPAQGFDLEARIVGELIPTRTSRNLIWLFKSRSALKRDLGAIRARPRPVQRLAVLGAGVMGGSIAQLAADHGTPVRLKDLRYEAILDALRSAHSIWSERARRGEISRRDIERRSAFIAPTLDDSGLRHADLVIEAVVETLETKQEALADAERRIGEHAVFASNTSCLPISEIAARAVRPGRVIGMHFFNPAHRMPLVEVIAGRLSSPEAVVTAHAYALRLGKVPVIVKDEPGFLVNRILMVYLNEALVMLREGTKVEALDRAMLEFGLPTGPFALLDHVGLESAERVGSVLRAAYGERIGGDESILDTMISDNRLGQKNGRGFYRYRNGKRTIPDPRVRRLLGAQDHRDIPTETLQERMVLAMINEAVVCLQDGVVKKPQEVDVAMVLGAGFPPFRGGPLRYADEIGVPILVDRLKRLADAHGERFRPADALHEMVRKQRRFYD